MEAEGHLACSGDTFLNDSNEEVYFLYCGEFVTQAEAQLTCQNYGYNLATVKDETENDEISSYFAWFFKAWFGLTDQALETVFVWPDGSSPSYTNWYDEMAPALSTAENCVAVSGDGVWYNEDCALERYYVCESR